jgi:predicted Zn-dependent protease with MMP-like domain
VQVPTDDEFDAMVGKAMDALPKQYTSRLKNVAIIYDDAPSLAQRQQLNLRNDQTLLGLYEGVPLPARGGAVRILPDKITLFKIPLANKSQDTKDLQENIRHTLWHEMAHYFGLNHSEISARE